MRGRGVRVHWPTLFTSCALLFVQAAFAGPAIMSGVLDGTEEQMINLVPDCNEDDKIHAVAGPLRVSQAGDYQYGDVSINYGQDVSMSLYRDNFNPDEPADNFIAGYDDEGLFAMQTGTDYFAVVQPLCDNEAGAWGVTLWGPGEVSGDDAVQAPQHWFGEFDGSEPRANTGPEDCPDTYFQASAPVRVDETGTYYFSDVAGWYDIALQLAVYRGSFDPDRPGRNRVASVSFPAEFELEASQDYLFVTQPACDVVTGNWFYVLAPPAPFEITPGLNGSWYNQATAGQGFFIDVLPEAGIVFYAEFAWDTSLPPPDSMAVIGDPGNRWFVGTAPYSKGDNSLDFTAYYTRGGLYNDPATVTETESGTVHLEFDDCEGGVRSWNLSGGVQGQAPFTRIANDNAALCRAQYQVPWIISHP
jgi:hypothetical protein